MKKILIAIMLLMATQAQASVIFQDDFEWSADWNSTQDLPVGCVWTSKTTVDPGGSYESMYVNATGAKNGSRGMIQYWDSPTSATHENWITKAGLTMPDEYYIGYWFKVDPSWSWGSAASLKIIKQNVGAANTTWDINWISQGTMNAYCCGDAAAGGLDDWCVINGTRWTGDSALLASIATDEMAYKMYGNWSEIDDGNWHYFVWHMKHSTETLELSVDGSNAYQMGANQWPPASNYSEGVNTERFSFGGNFSNGGGGVNEMYTAYDDVIIATTEAEVLSFLSVIATPVPGTHGAFTLRNGTAHP